MSAKSTESPEDRKTRKKAYLAAYYHANKERAKANKNRWKAEHPEQLRATRLAYMEANGDRVRAKQKEWWEANKGRINRELREEYAKDPTDKKERAAKWAKDNPDKVKAAKHAYYLENKSEWPAKTSAWKKAHPEAVLESARRWRRNNPKKAKEQGRIQRIKFRAERRAAQIQRRAKLKSVTVGNLKVISKWENRWRKAKSIACYWCQGLFRGKDCHMDHITSLANGGAHSIENLCVSCGDCNLRKHSKPIERWQKELESPVLLVA